MSDVTDVTDMKDLLEIRESRNGLGAFAKVLISAGSIVWDWSMCRRYTRDQIPTPYVLDEYLQVADNLYVGPDAGPHAWPSDPGDAINHSCRPNCVIMVELPSMIHLVSTRDIIEGSEVTYDYGLTIQNDPWSLQCNCGTPECRGIIRDLTERL